MRVAHVAECLGFLCTAPMLSSNGELLFVQLEGSFLCVCVCVCVCVSVILYDSFSHQKFPMVPMGDPDS